MPQNPVVIAGQLSKEELERSINEIVETIDDGMSKVVTTFDTKITELEGRFTMMGRNIATSLKMGLGMSFDELAQGIEKLNQASGNRIRSASSSAAANSASQANYGQDTIGELRQQIKELNTKLNYEKKSTDELRKQVDLLQQMKAELKAQTTGRTFSSVFDMKEDSVTKIAEKMKAYKSVVTSTADEQKNVTNEYQRLSQKQKELLGTTKSLTNGNNALARSFGYIRNRLVYALTIGSVMNFVKQMYSVRAEYELLERSMGVLIDNFRRGSEIFNELNAMALKSPFTLVELGTAAKQLLAYNFAEDEVVDTTRRLADISAALGVPMERLVYNLGQIRAQTALTARDARDFANAGLAIVPMLAKMYTEQKKFGDEIVTTAQVYDMMKKKLVSYEDVMKVINQITDEGGKFFDFQAKQAETLKVQLANLTLAWNNMLNDIATGNQSALNTPIRLIKQMFQNWREVAAAIKSVIAVLGVYKTMQFLQSDALIRSLRIIRVGWYQYTKEIQAASGAMATFNAITKSNVLLALAGVLASVASYFIFFKNKVNDASGEIERFGASGAKVIRDAENLYAILEVANKNSANYTKVMGELNQILEEYGLQTIKETDDINELNKSREKNIVLLKQEALEREHLNNISAINETYQSGYDNERKRLEKYLSKKPFIGKGQFSDNVYKYSFAISDIISSTVEENLNDVLNKSGDDYFKGVQRILEKVKAALLASNDVLGLSEQDIHLLTGESYGAARQSINNLKELKEAQDGNAEALNNVYNKNKELIDQSATFNDRVDQSRRKLELASNDTEKFYGKLNQIIKDFSGKNIIEFLVDVNAQVPEWMKKMGIDQVTRLASQFGALTENAVREGKEFVTLRSGERVTTQYLAMRTAQYTQARKDLEKAVEEPVKTSTTKKDDLGDALTKELQLINDIQKLYKEYTKAGISMDEAKIAAAKEYQKTLEATNATLSKYGVKGLSGEQLATMDMREMLAYYQSIIDKVQSSPKAVEALEKAIRNLNVQLTKEGQKTIIDSLNSELSKLKDEYELGVELDANPELGSAFAETFGFDMSALPTTIEEVVGRAQKVIDEKLGSAGLFNVLSGDIEDLRKTLGQSIDSGLIDAVEKAQKSVRELWKKDAQETISGWDKLLEKYAEYETKRTKIIEEAERERQLARKRGADGGVMGAIDVREAKELAKLEFDEFQKTPEWITATGDLAGLTDSALGLLINRIEQFKKSQKGLDAKQIKQLNNALKQLYQQQRKGNPFLQLSNAIMENRQRREEWVKELEEAGNELEEQNKKIADGAHLTEEETEKRLKLIDRIKELKEAIKNLADATPEQFVDYFKTIYDVSAQATGAVTDMLNAFGNTEIANKINKVMSALEKGFQFAQIGAAIGGKSGAGWGAAIGGILGLLAGGITAWADEISGNASITKAIERSERNVKQLNNEYKKLEQTVESTYGVEKYYAEHVAIANKKAQLAELERQLRLERSRDSKHKDQDKILDLEGQIIDLQNEISNNLNDIINDFMGISSVGDAVESMVGNIINALRNGENAMDSFDESVNDMIANMIKKLYSSKVLSVWFEDLWKDVEYNVNARTKQYEDDLANYQDYYMRWIQSMQSGVPNSAKFWVDGKWMPFDIYFGRKYGVTPYYSPYSNIDWGGENYNYQDIIDAIQRRLNDASQITLQDIEQFAELARAGQPMVEGQIEELQELLQRLGLIKDTATEKLSNLQQGIQGITEDTAGALEAYMNGVSQQVYLHSMLLTEIRDAVVGFSSDIQLGIQSQILLELQNSYQVQMAIQNILQGWSSASGLAVRVEMVE